MRTHYTVSIDSSPYSRVETEVFPTKKAALARFKEICKARGAAIPTIPTIGPNQWIETVVKHPSYRPVYISFARHLGAFDPLEHR